MCSPRRARSCRCYGCGLNCCDRCHPYPKFRSWHILPATKEPVMRIRVLAVTTTVLIAIATFAHAQEPFDIKMSEEFKKIIPDGAKVQKEASGFGFVEGPTWIKSGGGYLVFSDIPNNKIMKWTAKDGITVFRDDSKNSNGNTTDPDGLLVTAQHGSRSVTRTGKD